MLWPVDPRADRLDLQIDGDTIVAAGELDSYTAPLLAGALEATAHGATVDMAGVSFIDSSVLKMLVEWHERLGEQGMALQLRQPSKVVLRLLDVSGLSDYFTVV